jgi:hypothetical protein
MDMKHLTRSTFVLLATAACVVSTAASAQKKSPADSAVLLGQFGDWGAYRAEPGGKKVCFALSSRPRR